VSCCQKVCVNPAAPASGNVMSPDELQHLIVAHYAQGREFAEQINTRRGRGSTRQVHLRVQQFEPGD
jgi:hypothetical protein